MIFQLVIASVFFCFGCVFSMLISALSWVIYRLIKMILKMAIGLLWLIPRLIKSGYKFIKDIFDVIAGLRVLMVEGDYSLIECARYSLYFYRNRMNSELNKDSKILAQALVILKNNLKNDRDMLKIISNPQYISLKQYQEETLLHFNQRATRSDEIVLIVSKLCELREQFGYWFVNRSFIEVIAPVEPSEIAGVLQSIVLLAKVDKDSHEYQTLFEKIPVESAVVHRIIFDKKSQEIAHDSRQRKRHLD